MSLMVSQELALSQDKEEVFTQPRYYERFRCIGAACEDTCCQGWGVFVDKATYQKYQICGDSELSAKLKELVTIRPAGSDLLYASISSPGGRCSFLTGGLCSIQKRLGDEYLGHVCATYPRVLNTSGNRRERSLDLSCPEAARLALLDPARMDFGATAEETIDGVRKLILSLLQNRAYAVFKRLILVGMVCGEWRTLEGSSASPEGKARFLEDFATAVSGKQYDAYLASCVADPVTQLSTVLDLMVARLRMDYTSPRYRSICREFADGLGLKSGAVDWEEVGARYFDAYHGYYVPFFETHEYVLEHYLVAYAFKTRFPFGAPPVNRILDLERSVDPFVAQYLLLAAYFSVVKAVMIGLAAFHKGEFSAEHVVRAIQSISKTLEHCEPYPLRVIEVLGRNGIRDCVGMSLLAADVVRRDEGANLLL